MARTETGHLAVLLMAMGGPARLEEVEPYLLHVRGGRPTPAELVAEIQERYRLTGGSSPVLRISTALAGRLETLLERRGRRGVRVHVGMRHWHPFIADVYRAVLAQRPSAVLAICLAPQDSELSVGRYLAALGEAREAAGDPVPVVEVRSWCRHPLLVETFAANLTATLARFPEEARAGVPVVFTAHSLPERIVGEGDPYPREVADTAAAVAERAGLADHRVAYQSQGRSAEPWLGPGVEEVVEELAAAGHHSVVVAPVGFVSDHVETLFDLDIDLRARARDLGIRLERTPMPNDGEPLAAVLAALVEAHADAVAR